ncbi:13242_t:CDS:2, partial [Racocetra persica]
SLLQSIAESDPEGRFVDIENIQTYYKIAIPQYHQTLLQNQQLPDELYKSAVTLFLTIWLHKKTNPMGRRQKPLHTNCFCGFCGPIVNKIGIRPTPSGVSYPRFDAGTVISESTGWPNLLSFDAPENAILEYRIIKNCGNLPQDEKPRS